MGTLKVNGNISATGTIAASSFLGNATSADKLSTARTISLTGSVTGSSTFDGSGNLSIVTTTNHNHDSSYAKLTSPNNMIHSGNEWTVVPSAFSGALWLNYRTCGGTNGNITQYHFGNGKGGTGGVTLVADNFSGNASTANAVKDYNNNTLTYFGYSTSGMSASSVTWIGAWDASVSGQYRLRAVKQSDLKVAYASNADKVDNYHADSFLIKNGWWTSSDTSKNLNNLISGIVFSYTTHGAPHQWGTTACFTSGGNNSYNLQIHGTGDNYLYYRNKSSDYGQKGWLQIQATAGYGTSNPTATTYPAGTVYYKLI